MTTDQLGEQANTNAERPRTTRALAAVLLCYLVAIAAAAVCVQLTAAWSPLWRLALADGVATLVVFAFSRGFDNSSCYDAYWSVAPAVVAPWLAFDVFAKEGISVRKWLVLLAVLAWAVRLTFNWARQWRGFDHEDWRYARLRPVWGRAYWLGSLAGFHLFPTVCVFLGMIPLFGIMRSARPVGVLDLVAVSICWVGTMVEAIADEQMADFRRKEQGRPEGAPRVRFNGGLWRFSRHPNYVGECTFWIGLWLCGVAAEPAQAWYSAIGAVVIVLLFLFVSIPMADRRTKERRTDIASDASAAGAGSTEE